MQIGVVLQVVCVHASVNSTRTVGISRRGVLSTVTSHVLPSAKLRMSEVDCMIRLQLVVFDFAANGSVPIVLLHR